MIDKPEKSELDELMKEVPASTVPLVKPTEPEPLAEIDVDNILGTVWGRRSNQLLQDYKFGRGTAMLSDKDLSVTKFFKQLSYSLHSIISNEYQKRGESSESLSPHYDMIDACFLLLSREIQKKGLKDFDTTSIIAGLQGFITNYQQKKK